VYARAAVASPLRWLIGASGWGEFRPAKCLPSTTTRRPVSVRSLLAHAEQLDDADIVFVGSQAAKATISGTSTNTVISYHT
jgi:hypothetical protein